MAENRPREFVEDDLGNLSDIDVNDLLDDDDDDVVPYRSEEQEISWDDMAAKSLPDTMDIEKEHMLNDLRNKLTEEVESQEKKNKENDLKAKKEAEKRKRDEEEAARIRIKRFAPGLNVIKEQCFQFFQLEDLDLENDFQYKVRPNLIQLGLSDEEINGILRDPLNFVLFLAPRTKSELISNSEDFKSVCNYLVFASSVCTDTKLKDVLKNALFDLLRNYGYDSWKLKMKHVIEIFYNLGVMKDAILDPSLYDEHFKLLKESGYPLPDDAYGRENLPRNHPFFRRREKHPRTSTVDENVQVQAVGDFVELVCDLCTTFPDRMNFSVNESSSDVGKMMFIYVVTLVMTDRHFITDYLKHDKVQRMIDAIICTYPKNWLYESESNEIMPPCGCYMLAAAMTNVGKEPKELWTWTADDLTSKSNDDHHHNMLYRIEKLLPCTYRGKQLKKILAFFTFQILIPTIDLSFEVGNVNVLWRTIQENIGRFRKRSKELYIMLVLIFLIDIIVGNEPGSDFGKDGLDSINQLKSFLNSKIQDPMKDDVMNPDPSYVKEVISQLGQKWDLMVKGKGLTSYIGRYYDSGTSSQLSALTLGSMKSRKE